MSTASITSGMSTARWCPATTGSITAKPRAVGNHSRPSRIRHPAGALLPLAWLLGMPSPWSNTSTASRSLRPASTASKALRGMRNTPALLENHRLPVPSSSIRSKVSRGRPRRWSYWLKRPPRRRSTPWSLAIHRVPSASSRKSKLPIAG